MLLMLILAQTGASPPALNFDLATLDTKNPPCSVNKDATDGEIVVCGRRRDVDAYRLQPDRPEALTLPKAEIGLIGRARGKIDTEQVDVGGFPSNRVMLRVVIPF